MTPEKAKQICIEAHSGQWRNPITIETDSWDCYKQQVEFIHENGNKIIWVNRNTFLVYEPYSTHPITVADMMTTDEEKIIAYLHDVIENTSISFDNLVSAGANDKCLERIMLLTHVINEDYTHYIQKICIDKLATKVKLADMFHNMSTSTSEKQKAKYLKHIPILLNTL